MLATPADLAAWTGAAAPANATPLLRSASSLVISASSSSYYAADPVTGLASDPVVAQALNDATCIQAAMWVSAGIDPLAGGVGIVAPVRSKKIGSASLDYDTSASASVTAYNARMYAANNLCPEAVRKLQENNLMDSNVWMYG
jgi:hypothetical protein